jgi:adenylosuccinate synthase
VSPIITKSVIELFSTPEYSPKKPKAIAVIGANYGDEGKGATVHTLVKDRNATTVVRFNGGNQAGHTVQLKNGPRHVFSSYGAGTFHGAQTYISELALFNPLAAYKEKAALTKLGNTPQPLIVHPDTNVITPFDIALNQFLEMGRGEDRHGSCGMGIGETQRRIETPGAPKLLAKQLANPNELFIFMSDMRAWFKERIKIEAELGSFSFLDEYQKTKLYDLVLYPTMLITEMYKYVATLESVCVEPLDHIIGKTDHVVFEGAQGLLLDQDDPDHQPHVTWSKTGIENVVTLCTKYNLDLTEVYYVTRPYLTRHGTGHIHAGLECPNTWGEDRTNKENTYQGKLRYGHMNWSKFKQRIDKDCLKLGSFKPSVSVALTHEDQLLEGETYPFVTGEVTESSSRAILGEDYADKIRSTIEKEVKRISGLQG